MDIFLAGARNPLHNVFREQCAPRFCVCGYSTHADATQQKRFPQRCSHQPVALKIAERFALEQPIHITLHAIYPFNLFNVCLEIHRHFQTRDPRVLMNISRGMT